MGRKKYTIIMLLAVLIIGGILHGWNMFNFPYYESDEGTYISQAWSMVKEGRLSPYTYWYDHPPMGWNLMALWAQMFNGNFFAFGNAIDMGRAFMLVVHLISSLLIFFIINKITKSPLLSFFGVIIFSISPLAIYFQRRVLLDNIMMMWVLASIASLFVENVRLRHYVWSGIFFALAVLTKVTAVVFGPAILAFVYFRKCGVLKSFRTIIWLSISVSIVSLYALYAILKGEFLPQGILSENEHVSLITSILFQASRSSDTYFWNESSDFIVAVKDWIKKDSIIVIVSGIGIILSIIASFWHKNLRFFVAGILLYILFLIRGGVVINFYLIPLVPFVAIILPVLMHNLSVTINARKYLNYSVILILMAATFIYYGFYASRDHFVRNETIQQKNAVRWIKNNLPEDSSIIIDVYSLVDLWDSNYINSKSFKNADWFYKINRDVEVRDRKYKGNWRNFEYIALTHEMLKQIEKDEYPIAKEAYQNSFPVAKWTNNSFAYIDEQKFISTNGDWAMVFKVNGTTKSQLLESWKYYKDNFVYSYGQVIDPDNGITTSEGQSYALLRAAWMNDREAFKGIWLWTRDHMQFRLDDKLFSWKWEGDELKDSSNATDSDQDIAAALLFGYKIWGEEEYFKAAKEIINDIWKNTVVDINGRYYLLPMHKNIAERWNGYLFNPSYLSPMWYRMFAEVDASHDWNKLAEDSYIILNALGEAENNTTHLPPDWALLDKEKGSFSSAKEYFNYDTDNFSFDAFRTLWRVSLDYQWNQNNDAKAYLKRVNNKLIQQLKSRGSLPAVMNLSGKAVLGGNSLSVDSGYLSALMHYEDKSVSINFYRKFIESKMSEDNKYWGNKENYYDANWVWFSSGLFNENLPNLWEQVILKK